MLEQMFLRGGRWVPKSQLIKDNKNKPSKNKKDKQK